MQRLSELQTGLDHHGGMMSSRRYRLVPSPMTEALTVVDSLKHSVKDDSPRGSEASNFDGHIIPLKLALFNLSKFVREEEFAVEFMIRGGVRLLIELLERKVGGLSGNSLAVSTAGWCIYCCAADAGQYALQGVRGILEFESGWEDLSDDFINRVLSLLMTAAHPNVLRPTTAIVRKLIISSPQVDRARQRAHLKARGKGKGKEKEEPDPPTSPLMQYGFDKVFLRMEGMNDDGALGVMRVVVKRLEGTGDLELVAQRRALMINPSSELTKNSLGLINVCLRSAQQDNSPNYPGLAATVEALNVRKYVSVSLLNHALPVVLIRA